MNKQHLEKPLLIEESGNEFAAILHTAVQAKHSAETGLLIIVGGPQYRVGSHRQFVLLARHLSANGYPVFRFDYAGMGDSSGQNAHFETCGSVIDTAIATFLREQPQLKNIIVWGLCDGASAALMHASQHPNVKGLVLLNPWVSRPNSQAQAMVKHYYWERLRSKEFWQKLLGGGVSIGRALKEYLKKRRESHQAPPSENAQGDFVKRMLKKWQTFNGNVCVILSGKDLVAKEFEALCEAESAWQVVLKQAEIHRISAASHTFSSADWRARVEKISLDFCATISRNKIL